MKKLVLLLCLVCASCPAACERSAPSGGGSTSVTVAGVEYSIEGAAAQDLRVVNNNLTYRGGGLTVSARAGSLVVNGRSYGPVKAGERVSVSRSGKVLVDGEERTER